MGVKKIVFALLFLLYNILQTDAVIRTDNRTVTYYEGDTAELTWTFVANLSKEYTVALYNGGQYVLKNRVRLWSATFPDERLREDIVRGERKSSVEVTKHHLTLKIFDVRTEDTADISFTVSNATHEYLLSIQLIVLNQPCSLGAAAVTGLSIGCFVLGILLTATCFVAKSKRLGCFAKR